MTLSSSSSGSSSPVDSSGSSGSHIRKRARLAAPSPPSTMLQRSSAGEDSDSDAGHSPIKGKTCRRRDDTYYLADGSCVLLVEQTLFNVCLVIVIVIVAVLHIQRPVLQVHQTVLSRDSSSFSTMFPLPHGDREEEGSSDENPIVLVGDTVAEFKSLLWALYSLPHELAVVHTPMANLTQLIDITRVSNKYCFKSIETWALDAIQEHIDRKPSPIFNLLPSPSKYTFIPSPGVPPVTPPEPELLQENTAQLTRLVRLAQMCNHERLLTTMIGILRQMMSLSLKYAYLAMTLADELNLHDLRGAAYLEVMQRAVVVARTADGSGSEAAQGEVDEDGRLIVTPTQQLRLLSGYHRLTMTWEQLRVSPLHFDHAPSCGATWHQHGCTQSWLEFWKEKSRSDGVLNLGLADVVGRLKAIQKEFDRWGSASYMHHDCRMAAKRAIQERIKEVEDTLSDYFKDEVL